jgi:hypothetical protein
MQTAAALSNAAQTSKRSIGIMDYNVAYLFYLQYGFWPREYLESIGYPYPINVWGYGREPRRYPW